MTDVDAGLAAGTTVDPWARVVGQRPALEQLTRAADNPVHAYIFLGRPGAGSLEAAFGFAGLLLANAVADDGDPERALRLAVDRKHPDLTVFEPQGQALMVNEADEIIRAGLRAPVEADRKVIVLLGVETIPAVVVGKLLKVVEEPPPSAVFVLLAEEVTPDIVTIASRCVPVEFGPVPEAELAGALVDEGVEPQRASLAAGAAGGDVDRARLLATDDALADRAARWRAVPGELDGTGSRACELVDELRAGMDGAQEPLEARHGVELEELEARVEQLGERGSGRAALVARHKREIRRLRYDELRLGLAVLSRVYRDRLVAAPDPAAEQALSAIAGVVDNLVFNPNEALLLQQLFLTLSPAPPR